MGSSLKQIDFVLKLAFSKMTMLLSAQASKWAAQTTFISTHAEKKIEGTLLAMVTATAVEEKGEFCVTVVTQSLTLIANLVDQEF